MRGKEKDLAVAVVLAARCALSRDAKRGGTDLILRFCVWVRHDSFICATRLILEVQHFSLLFSLVLFIFVLGTEFCDMTRSCATCLMCAT